MQLRYLVLALLGILCAPNASMANVAFDSTSTFSAIAGECLRTVLDCVLQSPEADLALSRWGKTEDPASDCKFVCSNETLSIQVPGTHHALNPDAKNLLAPRVLQDVAGDFSIEVKVRCFEPPASGSSTNPVAATSSFIGSGILVWQDEKNFLRLMQAAIGDRQQKQIQLRVGNRLIFENVYTLDAEYLYLKVFRIGKIFGVSVSDDGKRWLVPSLSGVPLFQETTYGFGDSLRAGVVVVNAINQEIQGEFSELKVTNEPVSAAHDVFRAAWEFPKTALAELRDPRVQQDLQLKPDLLTALKEFDAQQRSLPVADRLNQNAQTAQDKALKAWTAIRPMMTAQQSKRLAGLAVQRFGPRSLLLDIVQEQLKLDESQLKSIASAREFLEESVAVRNNSRTITPESESQYSKLRSEANKLLIEVATGAGQQRVNELKGELFSFNLPGMILPEKLDGGHPMGPMADLLRQPAVLQELKLSRSVTEAIDQSLEMKSREVTAAIETLELDTSASPSPHVVKAWNDAYWSIDVLRREFELECGKQLTAAQNLRLQQILFQSLGSQTLLISDSARDALELTAQQRDDLRRIEEGLAKSQNFSNLLCKSLRRVTDVNALLSDQQREKIQRLKGATFYFVAVSR